MTTRKIADLEFLSGRWFGDGFTMEFGTPCGTMLFGSMQAIEGGVTTYWETFRFAREGQDLVCYPRQMGNPAGRFVLTELSTGPSAGAVFVNDGNPVHRRLRYSINEARDTLTITVEGQRDGKSFEQSWTFARQ